MATRNRLAVASVAALAASGLTVSGLAAGAVTANAAPSATAHQKVATVRTSLGRVLSSPSGMVMYLFEKDTRNVSHCDQLCQAYWPPVKSGGAPVAGAHISARHLGRTAAGQVTYYGHPLYYYAGDTKPKQTNGQGSSASGAKWYVVSPSGKAITRG